MLRFAHMHLTRIQKVLLGAAALLIAVGGGAAIAASQNDPPSEDSNAIINDAAEQLGIPPAKLSSALKKALSDRIDAAVAAGRLTKEEGDELKARIQSGDFPLFGGFHRGFGHFGGLDAAANYLGLTEMQLRSELAGGKTLAQVARDHGKSVDGLVDALLDEAKEKLDAAVQAGRITKDQEAEILGELKQRITNLVNSRGLGHPPFMRPGFGFHRFGRPFS
jgi:polyhydroxyalkanoate synthesis regulator phasin